MRCGLDVTELPEEDMVAILHTAKAGHTGNTTTLSDSHRNSKENTSELWSQMAERLGNRASNQKVATSIPGYAK